MLLKLCDVIVGLLGQLTSRLREREAECSDGHCTAQRPVNSGKVLGMRKTPTHFKNECDWNMLVAGSHWGTTCAGWTEGEGRKRRNGERRSVGRGHVNEF